MSRTSRGMRVRGWSRRRPRSGRQARAASRTKVRSPARSGLPGKLVEKRATLGCFVVAEKARDEIHQRQSEPPAWSDDLGRLITSDESLHFEGVQAVDIFERLQIVLVPARELHDRQVVSLGNKHRELRGSFEGNLLSSFLEA